MRGILTIIVMIGFFANPAAAQELTGTLQQIQKTGKIKIGYRLSQPPMSFLDKKANLPGIQSISVSILLMK